MFDDKELDIIINGYEKQATRLYKVILLLLFSNLLFLCLFMFVPSPIEIDLKQDKAISSTQLVNK